MNKIKSKKFFLILIMLFIPTVAIASDPVLFFSDITSGPKSGLGDGKGDGAIVTVWGKNLGGSQGSSKILIQGVEAAHVYYWCNADGGVSGGGPADLYSYHKMQEIAFSIPSGLPDGIVKIKVLVNSVFSNELDFTVRPGNIYFVKGTGNNSTGTGTWSNPWATVDFYDSPAGASAKPISQGSIIYVCNVTETDSVDIRDKTGTTLMPYALVTYPGTDYVITSTSSGIIDYYPYKSDYWVISKLKIAAEETGISAFYGLRAVGNEITDTTCATGQSGAISGSGRHAGGGIKCLGNFIHDFGCSSTISLHHVFYLSNRSGAPIEAYELGWNYLKDNEARHGLHIYDESTCGDYTGVFRIHDNVVVNQRGAAFNANASGINCITAPIEVYNNLFINCGLDPWQNNSIIVTMSGLTSHIKFFNNTIYGYGENADGVAVYIQSNGTSSWNFGGTYEWVNNIVVDTKNRPYYDLQYYKSPVISSNNIWYNGGDSSPLSTPAWDTEWNYENADPKFVDPSKGDFRLSTGSPAIDAGADLFDIVPKDMYGIKRGGGYTDDSKSDIGAFEYYVPPPSNIKIGR